MGTTSDAGTPGELEPRAALAALVRDLRARLGWHRRGGTWSVPGGPSPRSAAQQPGVAPSATPLMFVVEWPGDDQERGHEPLAGEAGDLFDKMVGAMGWDRSQVDLAIVSVPPRGGEGPQDAAGAARAVLEQRIQQVAPRVIVTFGESAANVVLGVDAPIGTLRGRFHEHGGVRVMPTYHPAHLLREPDRKRETWSDLKQVIGELERLGVPSPRPPRA